MDRIGDYALIGDCRSAALISSGGSIDWLCWPRFDSPSLFGALLDDAAGRFRIAPASAHRSQRRYVQDTNVLQTRFDTDGGAVVLTDLMPAASGEMQQRVLTPGHEVLRVLECVVGQVEIDVLFEPRPGYATDPVRLKDAGKLGIRLETREGLLVLRSQPSLELEGQTRARSRLKLRAGESAYFSLTYSEDWPAILPPLGPWSRTIIETSCDWWKRWVSRMSYAGPERDAVVRSALALRLMVYAPSGAVVAAPTTSLPERVGGDLNWDYRFCWLRDASLTVRALFGLGYRDEAEAFVSWLLHTTRLSRPELRVLYDVHGKRPQAERILQHFSGYRGSRPVRVGNGAASQFQLDVYGEVVDAVAQFVRQGGSLDRETAHMLCAFGEFVCRHWQEPDEGIWEPRWGKRHNTHSRVLCWVALDRLLKLHERGHLPHAPARAFDEHRRAIRRQIEQRAYDSKLQSYVAELDGSELDAALLLIPWYGFEEASSERMQGTYRRISERLGAGRGLLYRYRSNDPPEEGAFGICSFWGAEFLALGGGSVDEAMTRMHELCRLSNDVGLYGEEMDPDTGEALGNFPQAFTHVGLINAALTLAERMRGEPPRRTDVPRRQPGPATEMQP